MTLKLLIAAALLFGTAGQASAAPEELIVLAARGRCEVLASEFGPRLLRPGSRIAPSQTVRLSTEASLVLAGADDQVAVFRGPLEARLDDQLSNAQRAKEEGLFAFVSRQFALLGSQDQLGFHAPAAVRGAVETTPVTGPVRLVVPRSSRVSGRRPYFRWSGPPGLALRVQVVSWPALRLVCEADVTEDEWHFPPAPPQLEFERDYAWRLIDSRSRLEFRHFVSRRS